VIRGSWFVKVSALMRRYFFMGIVHRRVKSGCGVRGAGCGVREGVPLMRHEYVWGMCAGEGKTDFGLGISEFGKVCR